jgi:diphthine-ammonia ligase
MAPSLNVIALVSGGKDSFFSILHCQANGHTIVALANLHPIESTNDNEDIDSYMYQTVGHAVIPLYEQALGVPLYRQEIAGKAVNSSRDYEAPTEQEQDETEDLVPLLKKVLEAHPEANALSTGAILSTYQRTRVESVALRLGLTPLSYLWQYPLLPPYTQSSLLYDMAAVGQEAVIIKTASGGLDESFLGLDVASQRTIAKLSKAMARFGEAGNGAIVGEGGEFETLALNGPKPLWKKKIIIEASESESLDGGQTVLKIKKSTLRDKTDDVVEGAGALRISPLFDEEFSRILDATVKGDSSQAFSTSNPNAATDSMNPALVLDETYPVARLPENTYSNTPTMFTYTNLSSATQSSSHSSPSRQLTNILLRLDQVLKQSHLLKSNINHCVLLLRNMTDFTVLNPIYNQYFNTLNPPARVTISTGTTMPPTTDVMLSITLDKPTHNSNNNTTARQGLHVQGRSYWAPANIGPYSQAISHPLPCSYETHPTSEIVYIAGQIPLTPASMEVYTTHRFHGQALLSLQHLWRIGRAKNVVCWTAGVAFVPASLDDVDECVRVAQDLWGRLHVAPLEEGDGDEDEEGQDVDPWDRLNTASGKGFDDVTVRARIPDYRGIRCDGGRGFKPQCFVVQVDELPRNVQVEWSAVGLAGASMRVEEEGHVGFVTPEGTMSRFYAFEIRDHGDWGRVSARVWTSGTLYVGRGLSWDGQVELKGVQWIPCKRVWGRGGDEVRGVFVGRVDVDMEGHND